MTEKLVEVILDKANGYGVMMPESEAARYLKSMPKVDDKQMPKAEDKAVKPAEDKAAHDTEGKPASRRKAR